MRDTMHLGATPPEVDARRLVATTTTRARRECRAYIGLLRRSLVPELANASLTITSNPHDFSNYLAVVRYSALSVQEAVGCAF